MKVSPLFKLKKMGPYEKACYDAEQKRKNKPISENGSTPEFNALINELDRIQKILDDPKFYEQEYQKYLKNKNE